MESRMTCREFISLSVESFAAGAPWRHLSLALLSMSNGWVIVDSIRDGKLWLAVLAGVASVVMVLAAIVLTGSQIELAKIVARREQLDSIRTDYMDRMKHRLRLVDRQ